MTRVGAREQPPQVWASHCRLPGISAFGFLGLGAREVDGADGVYLKDLGEEEGVLVRLLELVWDRGS